METVVNASSGVMVWQVLVVVAVFLIAYFAVKYTTSGKADA